MFNPQQLFPERSSRALMFRQALTAAFRARRQNLLPVPASLPQLLVAAQHGVQNLLGHPGAREALTEIRDRLFNIPGREAEAHAWWHESVASAVFGSRAAQLRQASVSTVFGAGLLYRAGEALALKILASVELEYRLQLDSSTRRDWCASQGHELAERLVRQWNLPPEVGSCVLGWMRFSEFDAVSAESFALYFGRLFAVEALRPGSCVPGAIDVAAAELGLPADQVAHVRSEQSRVRELIRTLD